MKEKTTGRTTLGIQLEFDLIPHLSSATHRCVPGRLSARGDLNGAGRGGTGKGGVPREFILTTCH